MTPDPRTRIRRHPERGASDRDAVDAVLDAGLVAQVGFVDDAGQPFVIPVAYARDRDRVLVHGSVASRLMRHLAGGAPVCLAVTLLDGLVVARSLFNSSMNYRSVVVLGCASPVDDPQEKYDALLALSDRLIPGRVGEARAPTETEVRQTLVVALPLDECSVKVRTGGPCDEPEDLALPVWAGVIPLRVVAGEPVPADDLDPAVTAGPPAVR